MKIVGRRWFIWEMVTEAQKGRETEEEEIQLGCWYGSLSNHGFCPAGMHENPMDLPSDSLCGTGSL